MALEKGDRLLKDLRGNGYIFAKQLKVWRIKAGLTQAEAAKLSNISVKTLSEYENKKSLPTFRSLKKLSDVYDVSIDKMLAYLGWGLNPDNDELHPLELSSTQHLTTRIQNMISYLNDTEVKLVHSVIETLYKQTSRNMDDQALSHKKLTDIDDPTIPPKIARSLSKKKKDIQ